MNEAKKHDEKTEKLIEELKKRSARPCYKITIDEERKPEITDSKFGGVPYWDVQEPYPTDSKGNLMALLVQINLEKANVAEPLPQKGILQVFLSIDESFLFGLDRDSEGRQSNFKVVWHESIKDVDYDAIKALEMPIMTEENYSPVNGEYAINIMPGTSYITENDINYGALLADVAKTLFNDPVDPEMPWDYLQGETSDYVNEQLAGSSPHHQLLGNPCFEQGDPRGGRNKKRQNELLLQIDSDCLRSEERDYIERIMWGDLGTASFFINSEDLANHDFSDVLYAWECG